MTIRPFRRSVPANLTTRTSAIRPAILAAAAVVACSATGAMAQVDMTTPNWVVTGRDSSNWNGSLLYFTTQTPTANGWALTGYADWISFGNNRGRELFNGTLGNDLVLRFQGFQLINPIGITTGNYVANVTLDGNNIINGSWTGGSAGVWSAVRVPTPGAAAVLGLGGLLAARRRR